MSYSYSSGDGLSVLDPSTPAGSEPVSNGDDAIRQIKAFLRDTHPNGLAGLFSTVSTLNSIISAAAPKFQAGSSAHQSVVAGAGELKVVFGTVVFNVGSHFNVATQRFVAPEDGYYYFGGALRFDNTLASSPTGMVINIKIKRNGSNVRILEYPRDSDTIGNTWPYAAFLSLNTNDFIEIFVEVTIVSGSATWQVTGDSIKTIFEGFRVP